MSELQHIGSPVSLSDAASIHIPNTATTRTQRRRRQERKCTICSQTFTKTEHLARHIRSHTKEKPFKCSTCGKVYTRSDTLLRHEKSHSTLTPGTTEERDVIARRASTASAVRTDEGQQHAPAPLPIFPMEGLEEEHGTPPRGQCHGSFASDFPSNVAGSESWELSTNSLEPWLLGEDFDFSALNTSLLTTLSEWTNTAGFPPPANEPVQLNESVAPQGQQTGSRVVHKEDLICKSWYSNPCPEGPGKEPIDIPTEDLRVDEAYRANLAEKLQHQSQEEALPSTDFLNLCIRMYFSKFNAIFPIVHAPTFRPSSDNSLLLLSICSLGSLFIATSAAVAQGAQIFTRLNKAILASWESYFLAGGTEALSVIQAALLGQTYAMLSGNPKDLILVEVFHGSIVAWARKRNLFQYRPSLEPIENFVASNADQAWRLWARKEEEYRALLGLHIHDSELSTLFHHEPFLRHNVRKLPPAASDELFAAPTSGQWSSALEEHQRNMHFPFSPASQANGSDIRRLVEGSSRFVAYTILHGINASISEAKQMSGDSGLSQAEVQRFTNSLVLWYNRCQKSVPSNTYDPYCSMVLWHSAFMSMFADFNLLERAIGREGYTIAKEACTSTRLWASSAEAKRCIIHASLIQKQLESISLGTEPAIHVPRVLFFAALAWHCYIRFGTNRELRREDMEVEELRIIDTNVPQVLFEANGFRYGKPTPLDSSTLCTLVDFLQRIGHWGISRSFAGIIGSLNHGESTDMTP